MKKIELQSIQNGAALDLFNAELKKVLENIEDENTVAGTERSITIRLSIKPDNTRRTAALKVRAVRRV